MFVTVGSTAQVYRTLREANTSWSRGSTRQTTTCLGDIIRLSAGPGQKITVVSAKKIPLPVAVAEDRGIPDRRDRQRSAAASAFARTSTP